MAATLAAILFALFVWWFSTGIVIYLDGLQRQTFKWSMLGATVLLGLSWYGLWISADDATTGGAYTAFASALGCWAWHEISFYMGYVTGPRRHACAEGCRGWRHFGHAVQVSLWHELAILASFGVVAALARGGVNEVGLWTFVILWWMHESARLNVFLGVRNINAHFLPPHLAYLKSFLAVRPMNLLFPVSITLSTAVCAVLGTEAAFTADSFKSVGYTFLATMMALAILEHWFLVLPVPVETLWNWSMRSRPQGTDPRHEHPKHGLPPLAGLRPAEQK